GRNQRVSLVFYSAGVEISGFLSIFATHYQRYLITDNYNLSLNKIRVDKFACLQPQKKMLK
ncbi:MAG: hypothetical protein K2I91_03615, partial [Muribaculaceae bacterium]|nr:hypothetical protein [Muribaculaceae bacterium]